MLEDFKRGSAYQKESSNKNVAKKMIWGAAALQQYKNQELVVLSHTYTWTNQCLLGRWVLQGYFFCLAHFS